MRTFTLLSLLLALSACTSTRIVASPQQTGFAGLERGDRVELSLTDGETVNATFQSASKDSLVVSPRQGDRRVIALGDIRELRLREYDGAKTARAMLGATVITLAIALLYGNALAETLGGFSAWSQ